MCDGSVVGGKTSLSRPPAVKRPAVIGDRRHRGGGEIIVLREALFKVAFEVPASLCGESDGETVLKLRNDVNILRQNVLPCRFFHSVGPARKDVVAGAVRRDDRRRGDFGRGVAVLVIHLVSQPPRRTVYASALFGVVYGGVHYLLEGCGDGVCLARVPLQVEHGCGYLGGQCGLILHAAPTQESVAGLRLRRDGRSHAVAHDALARLAGCYAAALRSHEHNVIYRLETRIHGRIQLKSAVRARIVRPAVGPLGEGIAVASDSRDRSARLSLADLLTRVALHLAARRVRGLILYDGIPGLGLVAVQLADINIYVELIAFSDIKAALHRPSEPCGAAHEQHAVDKSVSAAVLQRPAGGDIDIAVTAVGVKGVLLAHAHAGVVEEPAAEIAVARTDLHRVKADGVAEHEHIVVFVRRQLPRSIGKFESQLAAVIADGTRDPVRNCHAVFAYREVAHIPQTLVSAVKRAISCGVVARRKGADGDQYVAYQHQRQKQFLFHTALRNKGIKCVMI